MLRRWRSNRRLLLELLGKVETLQAAELPAKVGALLGAMVRVEEAVNRAQPRPEPHPYGDV